MGALEVLKKKFARRGRRQYDLEDYIAEQKRRGFVGSKQVVDSTPMAPPIGYVRPPSMIDLVHQAVRSHHLAEAARSADMETFEEADDFDVPDEPEQMRSPWENDMDPPAGELYSAGREALRAREAERIKAAGANPPADGPEAEKKTELPPAAL